MALPHHTHTDMPTITPETQAKIDAGIIVEIPADEKRQWIVPGRYHQFDCVQCGEKDVQNTYSEPHRSGMLNNQMCFTCDYWRTEDDKMSANDFWKKMTIIAGCVYSPGNRTEGSFRGMAGRRFDIEYIGDSHYAGKRITTFDLWAGSKIPERYRAKYPDTAKFLNGAERVETKYVNRETGEPVAEKDLPPGTQTTYWAPSDNKTEPYPLPRSIGLF